MAVSGGKRGRQRRRTGAEERLLIVVAGPNGAGKSTFVETFLKPTGILIVNPDEVAKGLSPDSPEGVAYEAARVADTWRRDLAARGVSFCMETVFSDPQGAKLEFLPIERLHRHPRLHWLGERRIVARTRYTTRRARRA